MRTFSNASLPVPPWGLAVTSMLSVQLGSALSVGLFSSVGPTGTAWLRMTMGAIIFLILARPPLNSIRRQDVPALLILGIMTGIFTISFLNAIDRIPLGTAVSIEFLGPLTVAAARSHTRSALIWPAVALSGVILLTEPWQGDLNIPGIMFALLSAVGWGSYIVLTQHIGDRFDGIDSLSITVTIAAVTSAFFGIPQAAGHITFAVLAAALGLAILLPVLPFACEMLALRRMNPTAFGTLMALEPAFGTLLGLIVLKQQPSVIQVAGILMVVLAGGAAQRDGLRRSRGVEETGSASSSGDYDVARAVD